MGTWAAGNFDNDNAGDYVYELVGGLVKQIESTVASESKMEPDRSSSVIMMCNVELVWVLCRHLNMTPPKAATVEEWKQKYLAVWEAYIDQLSPKAAYKQQRRAVLVQTFDQLISYSVSVEQERAARAAARQRK